MKTFTHKDRSEVDIRVAQELKNDKDFKYETGQTIQGLANGLISLSLSHEKILANSQSDRKALLIEFENLRDSVLDSIHQMDSRLGDVETNLFEVLDSFTDLREEVKIEYLTKEAFTKAMAPECRKIDLLERDLVLKHDCLNLAIHQTKQQFKDQLEVVKKDLTPMTPKVDPIKQQIDERFKEWKVDFDGLIKEIALLKKAVGYDQKKFENIYTLIERLKEGKQ